MNIQALKDLKELALKQHKNHLVDPFRPETEYLKGHHAFLMTESKPPCMTCTVIQKAESQIESIEEQTTNETPSSRENACHA